MRCAQRDRRNQGAHSKSEGGIWANRGRRRHCSGAIVAVAECRTGVEPAMAGVAGAPSVLSVAKTRAMIGSKNKAVIHVGAVQRKNQALGQSSGKLMLGVIIKS